MDQSMPYSAECPNCGQERIQGSHEREELTELLRSGADIEAYCSSCDERWPISEEERADLARTLSRTASATNRGGAGDRT